MGNQISKDMVATAVQAALTAELAELQVIQVISEQQLEEQARKDLMKLAKCKYNRRNNMLRSLHQETISISSLFNFIEGEDGNMYANLSGRSRGFKSKGPTVNY